MAIDPQLVEVLQSIDRARFDEGIVSFDVTGDATHAKWDYAYAASPDDDASDHVFTECAVALIRRTWPTCPDGRFLELGCGEMKIGAQLATEGAEAYGLDFSTAALRRARERLRRSDLPIRLVRADIRRMPFADATFDAIYGGGVIEHVRELNETLRELRRVTKPGGVTVNTVPYLSLGALTYRQVWGIIPAVPVARQAAEFIHLRLLRGRHMRFGYERSYPQWMLRRAYRSGGFVDVEMGRYDVPLVFEYLPRRLRSVAAQLAEHRLFWPMIYVVARAPAT